MARRKFELTQTECMVMDLYCGGYSHKQIAREVNRSINTIQTHLRNIYHKMDVSSKTQASILYMTDLPKYKRDRITKVLLQG